MQKKTNGKAQKYIRFLILSISEKKMVRSNQRKKDQIQTKRNAILKVDMAQSQHWVIFKNLFAVPNGKARNIKKSKTSRKGAVTNPLAAVSSFVPHCV